jgi:hypothetical protein
VAPLGGTHATAMAARTLEGSEAAGRVTNEMAATKKGATAAEREERGLLPTRTREDSPRFYVGKCPCCGDTYLSNKHATQCGKKAIHESKGFGSKQLTLDRGSVSDKGECTAWKNKQ